MKDRLITRTGVLVFALLVFGIAPLCAEASATPKTKIRYAANVGDTLWLDFAKEKGLFKILDNAGIELDVIESKDKVALFASRQIDYADVSGPDAVVAIGKGAPFKAIANWRNTRVPFFLVAANGITSIKELKGHKIGIGAAGGSTEWYISALLKKEGLDPKKDVTLVNNASGWAALQAGFEAKLYDAVLIEEPFVSYNEKKGTGHFLANIWDYVPEVQPCYICASDDIIKSNPKAVKAILTFTNEVWKYAKAHQDEWAAANVRQKKTIDLETLKSSLVREDPAWTNILRIDDARLLQFQKSRLQFGLQKEIYDVKKIVDQQFVN